MTDMDWIVDGAKSKEKPRAVKGCQTSHCAYMLVYRLQSLSTGVCALDYMRLGVMLLK